MEEDTYKLTDVTKVLNFQTEVDAGDCNGYIKDVIKKFIGLIGERSALPELARQIVVTGKKKNNVVFVTADDLCTCLGATLRKSALLEAPFIENRRKYVPAELAALQMGELFIGWDSYASHKL